MTQQEQDQERECFVVAAQVMKHTRTNQGSPREKIKLALAIAYRLGRQKPVWDAPETKAETPEKPGETLIGAEADQA